MLIDFHTHVFPDAIAGRTLEKLSQAAKITPAFDGTAEGLYKHMQKAGADRCVLLPVVTSPKQFESINAFSAALDGKHGFTAFAGIHPDNEGAADKVNELYKRGFKGIKLHPDYQNTFIDDDRYAVIISAAVERRMTVVLHAGVDIGFPEPVHCTPERSVDMLKKVYGSANFKDEPRIVFAHMGGYAMQEEVCEKLLGKNILIDTAFCLDKYPKNTLMQMIRMHGADKVLFATDAPWGDIESYAGLIKRLPLTEQEYALITHKNALRLLGE